MTGKDAYWFSHDANAQNDERLVWLRGMQDDPVMAWAAYGLYWATIERLRECPGYSMDSGAIAVLWQCYGYPRQQWLELVKLMLERGLLVEEDGRIYSPSLRRRMLSWDDYRQKQSASGRAGAQKRWHRHSDPIGDPIGTANGTPMAIREEKRREEKKVSTDVDTPPNPQGGRASVKPDETGWVEFWERYPRKTAKAAAYRAWCKLNLETRRAAYTALRQHILHWQQSATPMDKVPHPATWLNGKRWEDVLPQPGQTFGSKPDPAQQVYKPATTYTPGGGAQ